jgi:hypothetical protein
LQFIFALGAMLINAIKPIIAMLLETNPLTINATRK